MTQWSPETQRLLRLAQDQDNPPEHAEERVHRGVLARMAAVSAGAAGTALVSTAQASLASVALKSLGIGVLSAVLMCGAWSGARLLVTGVPTAESDSAGRLEPSPAAKAEVPSARPARRRVAVSSGQGPADNSARPTEREYSAALADPGSAKVAKPPSVQTVPSSVPSPPAGPAAPSVGRLPRVPLESAGLAEETEALRAAHASLREGNAQQSLALLDAQDARYSGGVLMEERAAARILALCAAGQPEAARSSLEAFQVHWSRSPLLSRLRQSCVVPSR